MLDWVVHVGVDADVKVIRVSVVIRNVYIVTDLFIGSCFLPGSWQQKKSMNFDLKSWLHLRMLCCQYFHIYLGFKELANGYIIHQSTEILWLKK